jgi:hypothetical protein
MPAAPHGSFQDSTLIKPLPLPSRSFPIIIYLYHLPLYNLDIESIVKYTMKKTARQFLSVAWIFYMLSESSPHI